MHMQQSTTLRVVQITPIAVPLQNRCHRHRDDNKHNNTLHSNAPCLQYCCRRSGENDIILTIIHNNSRQEIKQQYTKYMAVLRGGIKIQMGIWVKIIFLQIYYATINCILFGVGGTRYGLFLISFACLILICWGGTDIEHTTTTKIKNI